MTCFKCVERAREVTKLSLSWLAVGLYQMVASLMSLSCGLRFPGGYQQNAAMSICPVHSWIYKVFSVLVSLLHSVGNENYYHYYYLLLQLLLRRRLLCYYYEYYRPTDATRLRWWCKKMTPGVLGIQHNLRTNIHPVRHWTHLASGKCEWNFRQVIFKLILEITGWCISCEIFLSWLSLGPADNKSTLV